MRYRTARLPEGVIGSARRYRYVFIVTYGRSGSTLLMGLLNTIPGYRIRGENRGALYHLYQADAALAHGYRRHRYDGPNSPQNPWYGTSAWQLREFRQGLADNFVANVLRPAPGDEVLGFKEIRYAPEHITDDDLLGYLEFLRTAFAPAKIIFNHRRPTDVARSAWWADDPESLRRIRAADERLLTIPADARHHHFQFDDIDGNLDNIRALFTFLGASMDEERVRATLAVRHSYTYHRPSGQVSAAQPSWALARRLRSAVRSIRPFS